MQCDIKLYLLALEKEKATESNIVQENMQAQGVVSVGAEQVIPNNDGSYIIFLLMHLRLTLLQGLLALQPVSGACASC